jgi:hypothetical protein
VEVLEATEGIPGDWAPIRLWVAREYLGEISAPQEPSREEEPLAAPPEVSAPGPYDLSTKAGTKAAIAAECRLQGIGLPAQIAYVLGTADHETGGTFQPVREAPKATEAWREEHFRYFPFYGRGLVQLTWENNYRSYSLKLTKRFGVPVDLVANPDEALKPEFSLFILVDGFKYGVFTGKKITDYINADETDFVEARRCINGLDCAEKIAALAKGYLEDLQAAEPSSAPTSPTPQRFPVIGQTEKWKGIIGQAFTPASFQDYVAGLSWEKWQPEFIVLHHTEDPSLASRPAGLTKQHILDLVSYYRDAQPGEKPAWSAGPHLFVDDDKIWVFTSLTEPGVHANSWNNRTLGIEMLGDYQRESFDTGRGAQVKALSVAAVAILSQALNLDPETMMFHRENGETPHHCPGDNVNKAEFIRLVKEYQS